MEENELDVLKNRLYESVKDLSGIQEEKSALMQEPEPNESRIVTLEYLETAKEGEIDQLRSDIESLGPENKMSLTDSLKEFAREVTDKVESAGNDFKDKVQDISNSALAATAAVGIGVISQINATTPDQELRKYTEDLITGVSDLLERKELTEGQGNDFSNKVQGDSKSTGFLKDVLTELHGEKEGLKEYDKIMENQNKPVVENQNSHSR